MKSITIGRIATPVAVLLAFLLPVIFSNTYYVTMFCLALVYMIIAFGLNFITGMTGQMNLGTAGIFCLGAYTSALLTTRLGVSPWLALLVEIPIGVAIGVGLGYPSLRLKGVYLSLTTIGFGEIVRQLANNMTDFTGGAQGVRNIPHFVFFGLVLDTKLRLYYLLLMAMLLFAAITHRIIHSKWGRAFIAIRDNIDAVDTCGISSAQIKIIAFTLAAVFGCIAGGLYAPYAGYISPTTFTLSLSVMFVVVVMVGGVGKLWGCIIGAVVVSMLPELLRFMGNYYQITYYALVLLCTIFMPGGILNLKIFKRMHEKMSASQKTGGAAQGNG